MPLARRVLRKLSREAYPPVLPVPGAAAAAEPFLEDLWRDAPVRVALAHTGLAAALWALPPLLLGRAALWPRLAQEEKEEMLLRMLSSRLYLLRTAAQVLKGAAAMAILRDPGVRERLSRSGETA